MYKVISSIYNVRLPNENIGFDLNGFLITSGQYLINQLFSEQLFKDHLGLIEYETLKSFSSISYLQEINFDSALDALRCMRITYDAMKVRVNAFWFLRDNSIFCNKLYFHYLTDRFIASDYYPISVSDASGLSTETLLTNEDWTTLLPMLPKIIEYTTSDNSAVPGVPLAYPNYITRQVAGIMNDTPYNLNRIKRGLIFVSFARENYFLPAKIFFYVAAFEALFKIGRNRIEEQIKQRSFKYLDDANINEKAYYKIIKDAYEIRSTFVHGREMLTEFEEKEIKRLISVQLDQFLRSIFIQIINDPNPIFLETDANIEAFFN